MSPKQLVTTMSEKKGTTLSGLGTLILSGVLTLLPDEVRAGCIDSITASDNPALIGGLMIVGVALTLIGPSLAPSK